MSDISSQINQILGDPEMMEQIKALSGLLSKGGADVQEKPAIPQKKEPSPLDLLGADGLKTAMQLMPLFTELKKDDPTTQLLYAIKPFLSQARQAKLDEAIRLLRVIKILPFLKQQGLMNLF